MLKINKIYIIYREKSLENGLLNEQFWAGMVIQKTTLLLKSKKLLKRKSGDVYKYNWSSFILIGYTPCVEHEVPSDHVDRYESLFIKPDSREEIKSIEVQSMLMARV
jgi:hypothetical protein